MLAVAILLLVGCASHNWYDATRDPAGKEFGALVDSDRARVLLDNLLARGSADARLANLASPAISADLRPGSHQGSIPDQAWLRELARDVSIDFAALSFAEAIGADPRSRAVQAAFDGALREGAPLSRERLKRGGFPFTVLFAPAWFYRSYPDNGSDFARQRRLLDELGIAHRLIEVAESGLVEDNAATIAQAVREAGRKQEAVILVSVSKSGAEVALALSRILTPAEAAPVAGWLNAAGAVYGTPLADAALRPPVSWMSRLVFAVAGWNREGLKSMATAPSRKRLEGARLPESIAVVNLVAVPVSGSIGTQVVLGYNILHDHGPNDGVVLLADTVWPGGANVVALGADHLLSSRQHEAHDMAMLQAIKFAVRLHGARAQRGSSSSLDRP